MPQGPYKAEEPAGKLADEKKLVGPVAVESKAAGHLIAIIEANKEDSTRVHDFAKKNGVWI